MKCPPSDDRSLSRLKALSATLNRLTRWFKALGQYTGWTRSTTPVYAALLSREVSAGVWTITWQSEPDTFYAVEQSTDKETWFPAASSVPAEDSPALITSWTSANITALGVVFFRVIPLPRTTIKCYTQDGQPPVPGFCLCTDPIATLE